MMFINGIIMESTLSRLYYFHFRSDSGRVPEQPISRTAGNSRCHIACGVNIDSLFVSLSDSPVASC